MPRVARWLLEIVIVMGGFIAVKTIIHSIPGAATSTPGKLILNA